MSAILYQTQGHFYTLILFFLEHLECFFFLREKKSLGCICEKFDSPPERGREKPTLHIFTLVDFFVNLLLQVYQGVPSLRSIQSEKLLNLMVNQAKQINEIIPTTN